MWPRSVRWRNQAVAEAAYARSLWGRAEFTSAILREAFRVALAAFPIQALGDLSLQVRVANAILALWSGSYLFGLRIVCRDRHLTLGTVTTCHSCSRLREISTSGHWRFSKALRVRAQISSSDPAAATGTSTPSWQGNLMSGAVLFSYTPRRSFIN